MEWITNDELVGQDVLIYTAYGEDEYATVLGIAPNGYTIKVRCHEDGEIMVGNQWTDA